ncbi:MAG TPA: hypothetical protein VGD17_12560 [Chitinophagaceae bacterium]
MKQLLKLLLLPSLVCIQYIAVAQQSRLDSLFNSKDSTAVLDSLLRDFGVYMDSLSKPKSFFSISAGIGTGYFSFENKNTFVFTTAKKPLLSPSAAYYHKSGLGLSATGFILLDGGNTNFYQFALSPSYDYMRSKIFSTGISFTKYFSKDSLPFYTTPIQQELFAYFGIRKWKLRPMLSVSYGWGSNEEYQQKQILIWNRWLQRSERGVITVKNEESVSDLAATASLRYNFMWFDLFSKDDGLTITPVALFTAGTQRFGFNTSYQSSSAVIRNNFLPSNQQISEQTGFGAQSVSFILRTDYSVGKFFIMPQLLLDYYLPDVDDRFNIAYSIVTGFNF